MVASTGVAPSIVTLTVVPTSVVPVTVTGSALVNELLELSYQLLYLAQVKFVSLDCLLGLLL